MMNMMSLESATGLPMKRKTHRGSRGGGKGPSMQTMARQHHNALNAAMGKGDFTAAKAHGLSLVNTLHKLTGPSMSSAMSAAPDGEMNEPMDDETQQPAALSSPSPAAPAKVPSMPMGDADPTKTARSKLAQTLARQRTK